MPGKVLTRILLDRVRQKLLTNQRHEQFGFTPTKSTVDRILAFCVRTKLLREFSVCVLAAYVDLRKAFDSLNRDGLWRILPFRGIPLKASQPDIRPVFWYREYALECDGTISDYFTVNTGVRQDCVPTILQHPWTMNWGGCRSAEKVGLWCVDRNTPDH